MGQYRYLPPGLGPFVFLPWLGLLSAAALAFLLFGNPNFLVASTRPAGYFGLALAAVTTAYFFRLDWHRRHAFETTEMELTVIGLRGTRTSIAWSEFQQATFHTNTGALILTRSHGTGPVTLYPVALTGGAALVKEIDGHTTLGLAAIADLQAAILR